MVIDLIKTIKAELEPEETENILKSGLPKFKKYMFEFRDIHGIELCIATSCGKRMTIYITITILPKDAVKKIVEYINNFSN